jgi:uncharacterized protein (TIGR02453 family)
MKIHPSALQFLIAINDHNTRKFFATVRPLYDEIQVSLLDLCASCMTAIRYFDTDITWLEPKACMFRIYRDARRLEEGDQIYKNNWWFVISPWGKKSSLPWYYLHIEPGNKSFFASGIYRPEPAQLLRLRKTFQTSGDAYRKIIATAAFKKLFGAPTGSALTRPPRWFSTDEKHLDLIIKKQHLIYVPISDEELMKTDITTWFAHCAQTAYPWVEFLRNAIDA